MCDCESTYKPFVCSIASITDLTPHEKLFRVEIPVDMDFTHQPGQFVLLSVWGFGEAPISISSSPTRPGYLDFAIRKAGSLTGALHLLKPGDKIGLRGPLGTCFNVDELRDKDLLLIAGGCGLAPLRSLIHYCQDRRNEFKQIKILYGAKTSEDLLYKPELSDWEQSDIFDCHVTIDSSDPDSNYTGKVGLLPDLIPPLDIDPENCAAVLVGPPVMYKYVIDQLKKKGLNEDQIIVSLERHMKCGIGNCGHCAIDHLLCCTDGPVFKLSALSEVRGAI